MLVNLNSLKFQFAEVSARAAIACYDWIGKGHEKKADEAAVNEMRKALNELPINGKIVIGEGERDEAPMLYIGEKVGNGTLELDIALDPLEGTTLCAHNAPGSMSVIAFAEKNSLLHAPDLYMNKIAVSGNLPANIIDIDKPIQENIYNLARAKNCKPEDLNIIVLKRDRHQKLIDDIRETNAKIELITDGDIAAIMNVANSNYKADMYVGIGGAPEGVLAAVALQATGGQMQARLIFANQKQEERAKKMGITDLNKKYYLDDLAKGNIILCATGVTDGNILKGVKKTNTHFIINTILLETKTKTVHFVTSEYHI